MTVTCYEYDREVHSQVYDEGHVLTLGEITDRLNRLAIMEQLFSGAQARCDKLEKAIRQLAHDHPDTAVSFPADGTTHYREIRDWAAHVLDEEPETSCPHCGRKLAVNAIGKMPLHTPPAAMTICPGVGQNPRGAADKRPLWKDQKPNSRLDRETIDRMVKDASWYSPERGPENQLMGDLSCHIKALACDLEAAKSCIEAVWEYVCGHRATAALDSEVAEHDTGDGMYGNTFAYYRGVRDGLGGPQRIIDRYRTEQVSKEPE